MAVNASVFAASSIRAACRSLARMTRATPLKIRIVTPLAINASPSVTSSSSACPSGQNRCDDATNARTAQSDHDTSPPARGPNTRNANAYTTGSHIACRISSNVLSARCDDAPANTIDTSIVATTNSTSACSIRSNAAGHRTTAYVNTSRPAATNRPIHDGHAIVCCVTMPYTAAPAADTAATGNSTSTIWRLIVPGVSDDSATLQSSATGRAARGAATAIDANADGVFLVIGTIAYGTEAVADVRPTKPPASLLRFARDPTRPAPHRRAASVRRSPLGTPQQPGCRTRHGPASGGLARARRPGRPRSA